MAASPGFSAAIFLLLFGTRPEAIKFAPLVRELRARGSEVLLVATGQHPELAGAMLQEVGLEVDVDLGIQRDGSTPADLLARILQRLPPLIARARPAMLLVQGDTVSALGGALAASYAQVPVGHVEAGLRTGNRAEPFPEEHQRIMIGALASLHFAPTERAAAALRAEGVAESAIHVTGNTGIDALMASVARLGSTPLLQYAMAARFAPILADGRPLLLATIHRRENQGARLGAISAALAAIAGQGRMQIVMPLHPNPRVKAHFKARLAGLPGVHLLPAISHAEMLWLMQRARLLLTDSGGLMEEAPALGLRTLVARKCSERPEAVDCGAATLVGHRTNVILEAVAAALAGPPIPPMFPFGDGRAAWRIANHLEAALGRPVERRALQPA